VPASRLTSTRKPMSLVACECARPKSREVALHVAGWVNSTQVVRLSLECVTHLTCSEEPGGRRAQHPAGCDSPGRMRTPPQRRAQSPAFASAAARHPKASSLCPPRPTVIRLASGQPSRMSCDIGCPTADRKACALRSTTTSMRSGRSTPPESVAVQTLPSVATRLLPASHLVRALYIRPERRPYATFTMQTADRDHEPSLWTNPPTRCAHRSAPRSNSTA
jgi:hypothetical protein